MFDIALTDHLEGPADQPSSQIFRDVADITRLADALGVRYAFFAEHHAHAHHGHCPTPLLYALHLAGQTRQIQLGPAIICLNLHHPLDVAEQLAVADTLCPGRIAPGFGSGSTPEEFKLFGLHETPEDERHARFEESLQIIRAAWSREGITQSGRYHSIPPHRPLPTPAPDLAARTWLAVNSVGSARIAGRFNFRMLFSHLRTPEQYAQYTAAYRAAGGQNLIAANRPCHVAKDDATAFAQAEPALRTLWRRFQNEGKIPADVSEPTNPHDLCHHPINFIVGGPQSVAAQLRDLHRQSGFDVANLEIHWAGLPKDLTLNCLQILMHEVLPLIR